MLFMIEDMVMSHGGSAVHRGVQVDRYGPFRGSVPKAAIPSRDMSPSPGLEYYNTETERKKIWLLVVSFGEDFNEDRVVVMETQTTAFLSP